MLSQVFPFILEFIWEIFMLQMKISLPLAPGKSFLCSCIIADLSSPVLRKWDEEKKNQIYRSKYCRRVHCLHHDESAGHLWFIRNTIQFSKTHIFPNIQEQPYSNLIHSFNFLLTIKRLGGKVIFWALLQWLLLAHGRSWSGPACGIFLDQGWNPCLLNQQVGSLPLSHWWSPL